MMVEKTRSIGVEIRHSVSEIPFQTFTSFNLRSKTEVILIGRLVSFFPGNNARLETLCVHRFDFLWRVVKKQLLLISPPPSYCNNLFSKLHAEFFIAEFSRERKEKKTEQASILLSEFKILEEILLDGQLTLTSWQYMLSHAFSSIFVLASFLFTEICFSAFYLGFKSGNRCRPQFQHVYSKF